MLQQRRDPPVPPSLPLPVLPPADIRPPRGPWGLRARAADPVDRASWSALSSALFLSPLRSLAAGQQLRSPTPLSAFLCGGWVEHHLRGLPVPCTLAGSPPTRTFFLLWSQPVTESLGFLQLKARVHPESPEPFPTLLLFQRPPRDQHNGTASPLGHPASGPAAPTLAPLNVYSSLCCSPGTSPYTGQEAAEPASPSQRSQPLPKPHG